MSRKAITVHIVATASGANFFWELRHAVDGRRIADSLSEGEFSVFASEAAAMADAFKIAAVYMTHGASVTAIGETV